VLGGTGFIGRHVVGRLLQAGAKVTTIQRGRTGPAAAPGARSLAADRADVAALQAALADAAPAVLVDMIAYTAEDAERLVLSLPASLERLVVISSGDVYWSYGAFLGYEQAEPPRRPLDENAPLRATRYPYRATASGPEDMRYRYEKLDVEEIAGRAPVPVTVLRLPMVYGLNDRQGRVAGSLARLRSGGGTVRLNAAESEWRCTRGYVEDVAAGIALAALDGRAVGATYNLGEPDALSEREWLETVAEAAGVACNVIPDDDVAPSLPANWAIPLVTDTRRIRSELGYLEPVGRSEGVRRSLAPLSP
jgi:nucleoside-diphosphate-sugar epimerase